MFILKVSCAFDAVSENFTVPEEVARLLINNSVDANAIDNEGQSPLLIALSNGHEKIAKLLIPYSANVNAFNPSSHCATLID